MSAADEGGAGAARQRLELWTWAALATGLATAALFLYLGLRPGGRGPILAYHQGRTAIFLLAALLLVAGIVLGLRRRPLLQRGRLAGFLSLGAALLFSAYPLPYPSSHEGRPSSVAFRLPFEGEWVCRWGGSRGSTNPLVLLPDRRFGYHFVRADAEGRSGGREASLCRGETVLAPADGTVAALRDSLSDLDAGSGPGSVYGNYVVLRVAEGQFLVLAGLEQGSLTVEFGQEVAAGDPLGRVGFSARSPITPEPHLALHLQDSVEPGRGEGIPLLFRGYTSSGRPVDKGTPRGGLSGGRNVGERIQARPAR